MDVAIRQEAEPHRVIANATQLYQALDCRGRATWGFLDWSRAVSKGSNVSRTAAFRLGMALVSAFGSPSRAADLIGHVPMQAPPPVAVPFDWTGAYFGGHVGYAVGQSDWSAN